MLRSALLGFRITKFEVFSPFKDKRFSFQKKIILCSRLISTDRNLLCEINCDLDEAIFKDAQYEEIARDFYLHPGMGHNVLLIQPRIKTGPGNERKETSELKLSEAVALVNTLPNWKVWQKHVVTSPSLKSKFVFGKGNLEKIWHMIKSNPSVTALFIGVDILNALQMNNLEAYFKVPVFDRYQIILQIFHDHAHTKEAKLQLALAEIPYLRVKLRSYSHSRNSETFTGIHHVGGDGESFMETRRRLLNERELKLKKALEKVKKQREFLRENQRRSSHPVIAVVGYTNCGKTTLIKAFTNDDALLPQDKLFATLDVTLHAGFLPSNQKVLFIDTVGFISNVPTALIHSFRSTLEEIILADLVIHIRDISHPDTEMQKQTVLKTLEELGLPERLLNSVLEVGNKVDLVDKSLIGENPDLHLISATEGSGLPELLETVEKKLFENTGHDVVLLRIPNGREEYSWLLKETGVRDAMPDPKDVNYLIMEVVMSSVSLAKFKHTFGDLTVSIESLSKEN